MTRPPSVVPYPAQLPAAAHGELEAALARGVDDRCNVIGAGGSGERERSPVDALEEDLSPIVVGGIVRGDQLALELGSKVFEGDVLGLFGC
jgi:hypothetical protein